MKNNSTLKFPPHLPKTNENKKWNIAQEESAGSIGGPNTGLCAREPAGEKMYLLLAGMEVLRNPLALLELHRSS